MIEKYPKPNPCFENFTQIPPLQATLWFMYRLCMRYLEMRLRNIWALFMCLNNIDEPNAPFMNLPRRHPSKPPLKATFWFKHRLFTDIIECNCAKFMSFKNIQDPRPYDENSLDFSPDSSPRIWASAVFEISLSASGLHLCVLYVLEEYPSESS